MKTWTNEECRLSIDRFIIYCQDRDNHSSRCASTTCSPEARFARAYEFSQAGPNAGIDYLFTDNHMGNCERCFAAGCLGDTCMTCAPRSNVVSFLLEDASMHVNPFRLSRLCGQLPQAWPLPYYDFRNLRNTWSIPPTVIRNAIEIWEPNDIRRMCRKISFLDIILQFGPNHPGLTWFFYAYFWHAPRDYAFWFKNDHDYDSDLFSSDDEP